MRLFNEPFVLQYFSIIWPMRNGVIFSGTQPSHSRVNSYIKTGFRFPPLRFCYNLIATWSASFKIFWDVNLECKYDTVRPFAKVSSPWYLFLFVEFSAMYFWNQFSLAFSHNLILILPSIRIWKKEKIFSSFGKD